MGVVSLRYSFSVSVLLHVTAIFVWVLIFGRHTAIDSRRKVTWIELSPDPVPKKIQKDANNSKRIVQTTAGEKTKTPTPDAFLGERNQVVDQQTVSRRQFIAMGQQGQMQEKLRPKEKLQELARKETALGHLGVAIVPKKTAKNPSEREALERLAPTFVQDSGIPQDYIKGLKESERMALNTKEYMFYGYFQRIRQRLDLAWSGTLREKLVKLYRRGRQLASDMDHTTRLLVTLNVRGEIVRVQVMEESGTRDLDEAAVNAFNKSGPFPNPPHGIVDRNGLIQIRWDFVLKT